MPNFGSLKVRVIILVSLAVVLFFIFEVLISQSMFLNGFKQVEQSNMREDLSRTEGLLKDQVSNYAAKIGDWAIWDDAYKFAQDKNQTFVDSNLNPSNFTAIKLNFMMFVATSGGVIYDKGADLGKVEYMPVPKDLENYFKDPQSDVFKSIINHRASGIIMLKQGPLLFSSAPIVKSDQSGPVFAYLVFGKLLDKPLITYLSGLNRSQLKIVDYSVSSPEKEFEDAKKSLDSGNKYFIQVVSSSEIAGFIIIKDFAGKPAFILEDELPRPLYNQGLLAVNSFLIFFGLASLIYLIFVVFIADHFFVSKIIKLSNDVDKVRDPKNPTMRLAVTGKDEISSVTLSINNLLDEITKKEEEYKKQSEELKLKVEDLEKFQNLTVGRELKMIELKKRLAEVEGNAAKVEPEEVKNGQ